MKKLKILSIFTILMLPVIASAQILDAGGTFTQLAIKTLEVISLLMKTLFAVIALYIIFTTWKYINALREGNKDAATHRSRLIAAIIGFAVAFSLWSIIGLFSNTMGWTKVGIPYFTAPNSN